jgi:hypothetical protein
VSKDLLNKVVAKEVARDLKKYKSCLGKTPNKENRRLMSAEKSTISPTTKRLNFGSPIGGREGVFSPNLNHGGHSREVRDLLKELDGALHSKVSLMKMLTVKCSDADSTYKKARSLLAKGDLN